MTLLQIAALFIIYSILGWLVDASYRTYEAGHIKRGGFSRYPFSPVYGFAALLATTIGPSLAPLPFVIEILAYSIVMGSFEYVSGIVVVAVFKKRLWNYRGVAWNLKGHTAPQYALAWGVISIYLVHGLNPAILAYLK